MKLKFLVLLPIFLFAFAYGSAGAQMEILSAPMLTSAEFLDESSRVGVYMKVYVDTELTKKIDNLEIRRITLVDWSGHASIREEFQRAVKRQKYTCRLVAAVHNLDDNSLMFYYVRME